MISFIKFMNHSESSQSGKDDDTSSISEIIAEAEFEDALGEAVYKFNIQPRVGVPLLCELSHVDQQPQNIAHILHTVHGLLSQQIGEYLSKASNAEILSCYFHEMNLDHDFVSSMRVALSDSFHLPGEAEQIDRVVHVFAKVFCEKYPDVFPSTDVAYILAFALIMLNSDQHNPHVMKRMTLKQFIENIRGALPESVVSNELLNTMFEEIHANPFTFRSDSPDDFLALSAPKLHGFLKKKTNKWKSIWTKHFFVLANSCLYYFENDDPVNKDNPLGMIQLISVKVSMVENEPHRIEIDGIDNDIQIVKFKHSHPDLDHDVRKIFLEAPSEHIAQKWTYRLHQSVICSNFTNGNQQHMVKNLSSIGQSASEMSTDFGSYHI